MTRGSVLVKALTLLQEWTSKGPDFWPKEEAIQGWFCAALRKSDFVTHPMEIVQEVHLGEKNPHDPFLSDARQHVKDSIKETGHVRFDVVALDSEASGDVRNLESCSSAPLLVVEVKALNSAGRLSGRQLSSDLRKLQAAKYYMDRRFPNNDTIAMLLIVATACKDADGPTAARKRMKSIRQWVEQQPTSPSEPRVSIALVLEGEIVCHPSF